MSSRLSSFAAVVCLLSAATAAPVFAQGPYVSASLVGDVARVSHVEGLDDASGSGEALGFALRLGTEVGSKWGVEAEYARPSEIESTRTPDFLPLGEVRQRLGALIGAGGGFPGFDPSFPVFQYEVRTRQRNTTLSASVWVRQELTPKVSLAYLGGVSFQRTSQEFEIAFETPRRPMPAIYPLSTETVTYRAGPLAGVEARIGLTEQMQLVPGVRLHGLDGGWLLRSSVGLAWVF